MASDEQSSRLYFRICRDARPCWYLHAVWSDLGQRQPADRWLRAALERPGPEELTPAERRELNLAGGLLRDDRWRK